MFALPGLVSASGSTEFPIFADFPMWVPVAGGLPRVTPYINEVHAKSATPNRVELFEDATKSKLSTPGRVGGWQSVC